MCKQGLYAEWWDYSDLNEKGPLHSSRTKKEGQYWPLDSRQHCTCCRTAVPLLWIEGQFGLMHLILFKFRRLHIFCRFLFGKVFKVTLHGGNCRCFYRQFSVVVLGTSLFSVTYSAFQAKPSRPPGCLMIDCLCWGGRDFESLAEDCSWAYWFPSFRGPDLYLNGWGYHPVSQ